MRSFYKLNNFHYWLQGVLLSNIIGEKSTIRSELGSSYGQRLDYRSTSIGEYIFSLFNRFAKESLIVGLHTSIVRPGQQYIKY